MDGDRVAAVPEPNAAPAFRRAVVALSGHPNGTRLIQLVAEAGKPHKAELVGVHVVEVDWSMPLDADLAGRSEEIQQVLDLAETTAEHVGIKLEPVLLQARDVGAALVDEAVEREADLLVVGLAYRTKFGGDFAIGPDHPLRAEERTVCGLGRARADPGGERVKIVIVGCGRVGSVLADSFDRAGHDVIVIDASTQAFDRLPGSFAAPPSAATAPTRTPSAGPAPRAPTCSWR